MAGFVEAPTFYPYLSGAAQPRAAGRLRRRRRASGGSTAALDAVDLTDRAGDRVGGYSHGMRQRLGIAAALLRDPQLLLLDEPATGLDPAGMRDMRLLIRRLADEGMTVLLSSHLLAEVEELCNRVAIVRTGRIVYEGDDRRARARRGHDVPAGHHRRRSGRWRSARAQPGIARRCASSTSGSAFTADEAAVAELSQALIEAGALIHELAPQTVTLEDLFFSLTEGDDRRLRRAAAGARATREAARMKPGGAPPSTAGS